MIVYIPVYELTKTYTKTYKYIEEAIEAAEKLQLPTDDIGISFDDDVKEIVKFDTSYNKISKEEIYTSKRELICMKGYIKSYLY